MFVVLEGIDGCGKTTQSKRLAAWLGRELGEGCVLSTREPGGWDGGEDVRAFALGGRVSSLWGEFFLFMMDRCEHVSRVINPAIKSGKFVLCDRYVPSTMAYQIMSNPGISGEAAKYMAGLPEIIGLPEPDCVFLLDIDPDTAARRLGGRGKPDSFDARGKMFFERVRDSYDRLMRSSQGRWVKVDARLDEESVFDEIARHIGGMLAPRAGVLQ